MVFLFSAGVSILLRSNTSNLVLAAPKKQLWSIHILKRYGARPGPSALSYRGSQEAVVHFRCVMGSDIMDSFVVLLVTHREPIIDTSGVN